MGNNSIYNRKNEKGITLVVLVVTIIVLLILAFIGVSVLMGEDSLIDKATESREETIKAQEREYIKLAYQNLESKRMTEGIDITAQAIINELHQYDKNTTINVIDESQINNLEIVIRRNDAVGYAEIEYTKTKTNI